MKKLIMVLGMHRSGTSVVTQLCQCMGGYLGEEDELITASKDNPDGYFENKDITCIDDEILHLAGREWYSLGMLEADYDYTQLAKVMAELRSSIQKLLKRGNIVTIKDPRTAVLLPVWEKILVELEVEVHYIWVFRNPLEVAESLRKRDGYSREHGVLLWAYYNLSILNYLKGKEYKLVHYRDLLENVQIIEELNQLFGSETDESLKYKQERIIKRGYCHSEYSVQDVWDIQDKLVSDFYCSLLKNEGLEQKILDWEKQYTERIPQEKERYIDYDVLDNNSSLKEKDIVIYGAGKCGKQVAGMLQQMGFRYDFCDKDIHKQGALLMGGHVLSIEDAKEKEKLCFIIAIEKESLKKEIEQTLLCVKKASFLSSFAVQLLSKCFICENTVLETKAEIFSSGYKRMVSQWGMIKDACKYPVLVYQGGKVGSLTVSQSLWKAGVKNTHIHGFFFKNDIVAELLLKDWYRDFVKSSSIYQFHSPEYAKYVKDEMKGKKIITMVREPIAVDLSRVFQWIGTGIADSYLRQQLKQGKTFLEIVYTLMMRIQDRVFILFDEELKELCGVDVFAYPFDKEKGYVRIKENGVEILLMKAEKLSQMTEVIRKFTGNQQLELKNQNVGKDKEYAHIYEEVKKKLEIPREYAEHYYRNNPYMDHFYTEEEKKNFYKKWMKNIKD